MKEKRMRRLNWYTVSKCLVNWLRPILTKLISKYQSIWSCGLGFLEKALIKWGFSRFLGLCRVYPGWNILSSSMWHFSNTFAPSRGLHKEEGYWKGFRFVMELRLYLISWLRMIPCYFFRAPNQQVSIGKGFLTTCASVRDQLIKSVPYCSWIIVWLMLGKK